eukprot:9320060-Alexandrium_andersonii.AAC.1
MQPHWGRGGRARSTGSRKSWDMKCARSWDMNCKRGVRGHEQQPRWSSGTQKAPEVLGHEVHAEGVRGNEDAREAALGRDAGEQAQGHGGGLAPL